MQSVPPLPELTDLEYELLRAVFEHVLERGQPASAATLSAATGHDPATVTATLAGLAEAGRLRRTEAGEVTGAFGLTVDQTRHRVLIDGVPRHTWCAVDALGILGALGATGDIRTESPQTGQAIRVEFTGGEVSGGDVDSVVLVATYRPGVKVVDAWCPLVNFFANAADAQDWAAEQNVDGECVPLLTAAAVAAQRWQRLLARDRSAGPARSGAAHIGAAT